MKEELSVHEDCIPEIRKIIDNTSNPDLQRMLFYLFYRIKKSGLEDGLIHIDDDLSKLYMNIWKDYDKRIHEKELLSKLSRVLTETFTGSDLEILSNTSNFQITIPDEKGH